MNLRQLECFRAVLSAGTMIRAAEILGISQPAVSNLIAALEREVGFALFRRLNGRLRPTPEAGYFYEEVDRALESFDKAAQTAKDIRETKFGQLVIASYPGIAIDFLPMVISKLLLKRPNVRFRLVSRSSQIVREFIQAQRFDIGIAELPVEHPAVRTESLSFHCVCVLPSGHPLTAKRVIGPKDLDGVPFICLFRDHMTYQRLGNAFAAANSNWNVVAETQYFATACSFVKYGAGVSVVDPFTAANYAKKGLVRRPFEPTIHYDVGILYPADRVRSRLLEEFVALFKKEIQMYLGGPLS